MPTVAQARTALARYAGANNTFIDRLNLSLERLIKSGNWRGTKVNTVFNVFPDTNNRAVITLPRGLNTILAGVFLNTCSSGNAYGYPLPIRNGWYSFNQNGPGLIENSLYRWNGGLEAEEGWFRTFRDWTTPLQLRFKFAATEANGGIINVRGLFNNQPIYTGAGVNTIEGENLTIAGATTLTTTNSFQEPPYALVKPVTYGRVSMYTWDGSTETLVAIYDPTETVPQWRRYLPPACAQWTESDPGQFLCICKRSFVILANDNDEVIPGNLGALRFAIEALLKEDAQDFTRAEQMWEKAYDLLAREADDDTGASAEGSVSVANDFQLYNVGGLT